MEVSKRPAENQIKTCLAQKVLGRQEVTVRAFSSTKSIFLLSAVNIINNINIPV